MPETAVPVLLAIFAVLLLTAVQSLAVFNEFALVAIPPTTVAALRERGGRLDRLVDKSVKDLDNYIAADQLAITITTIGAGFLGQPAVTAFLAPVVAATGLEGATVTVISGVIAFTFLISLQMIFGELVPKSIALRYPEKTARLLAIPVEILALVLRPVTLLLNGIGRLILQPFGIQAGMASHHRSSGIVELAESIEASAQAGLLGVRPGTVRNALLFGELSARDVMRPRSEMVALAADMTVSQLMDAARRSPHVRYAVYRESLDDIFGFLNITDLCGRDLHDEQGPEAWLPLVRPIVALFELASLETVLAILQGRRQQIALVVDEQGGTEGVLTLTDVMRGLIDPVARVQAQSDDGTLTVTGIESLRSLETRYGLRLASPTTSAATLNGLITELLGRFPQVDDRIELDDHHLTVRSVGGNRANEVLIKRVGTVPPPAADESVGAGLGTGVNPTEDP
ncbi:MAG: hemolysin family protein [Chloroflexota bacterium]|nr:hemolysin family protein [Chloroflexota bacterium]